MLAKAYNKMTETVQLCLVLQAIEWESAVLVCFFIFGKDGEEGVLSGVLDGADCPQ